MKEKLRDNSIDFLRTIAILLMIFAHTNMLLRIESNPVNDFIQNLGNTACFALFIFCAGASLFYSREDRNSKKLLKRIGLLYFAYLIVVALSMVENRVTDGLDILYYISFIKLPGYGEFLVAFILLDIIYLFFKKPIDYITKDYSLTIIIGATLFGFGTFLLDLSYHSFLTDLLWGRKDIFTFPIFQYFIIFLLGMLYSNLKSKGELDNKLLILVTIIIASIFYLSSFLNPDFNLEYYRWPPSLLFILGNLMIIGIFLIVFNFGQRLIDHYNNIFKIPSTYGFHLFYIHITILYLLRWAGVGSSILWSYALSLVITALPFVFRYAKTKT